MTRRERLAALLVRVDYMNWRSDELADRLLDNGIFDLDREALARALRSVTLSDRPEEKLAAAIAEAYEKEIGG